RAVKAVLRLQQPVEDGQRGIEIDVERLPVGPIEPVRLEAPHLESELSHLSSPYPSSYAGPSVGPLLRLPLGDGHVGVADLGPIIGACEVDVLEPLLVVSLREVGPELGAAALSAVDRRDAGALGAIEHVAELEGSEHVLIEDLALVVDVAALGLLLQPRHRL